MSLPAAGAAKALAAGRKAAIRARMSEKYGVALRAANTIVQNHAGFDIEGNVKHEVQAARSVRDLAMYLQIMRGLREKIDEIPGDGHIISK